MKNKSIIFIFVVVFFCSCKGGDDTKGEPNMVTFNWKKTSQHPSDFSTGIDTLNKLIEQGKYGYIDEILIAQNDTILYQEKFDLDYASISKGKTGKMGCGSDACKDSSDIHIYNYYHPRYHPYYHESKIHTLQSITKSVASTIVGAAIHDGKLKGVDESVYPYFKDYSLSDSMASHLKSTTIQDLLSMQLGLEWKEFGLSLEMETSVSEMELSKDWIDYTLQQSIEDAPGQRWNYNSGASQLLSKVILESTDQGIDEYGQKVLFQKLDIENYYWKKTPSGLPDTEGGLYLQIEDLAKIGLLHLQNGQWNNEQILPTNWVNEAFEKHAKDIYQDGGKEGYGYQWWITADEPAHVVGLGYGNQILLIIPDQNIIAVVYAWNIFDNEAKYIFRDLVDVVMSLK